MTNSYRHKLAGFKWIEPSTFRRHILVLYHFPIHLVIAEWLLIRDFRLIFLVESDRFSLGFFLQKNTTQCQQSFENRFVNSSGLQTLQVNRMHHIILCYKKIQYNGIFWGEKKELEFLWMRNFQVKRFLLLN